MGDVCSTALLALQHTPHPLPFHCTHMIIVHLAKLQLSFIVRLGLPTDTEYTVRPALEQLTLKQW